MFRGSNSLRSDERLPVNATLDSARAGNGISIGNNTLNTGYSWVPFQEKKRKRKSVGDSKINGSWKGGPMTASNR